MSQMLDIPNALAQGFTNWGDTAGRNISEGLQQNALANALQSGDKGAVTNALARISPLAAISYQQGNQKFATEEADKKLAQHNLALVGGIARTMQLPEDQRPAAWKAFATNLGQQSGGMEPGDDDWNTALAHAPALASIDKNHADVLARFGAIPQEPAKPEGLTELQRNLKDPVAAAFLRDQEANKLKMREMGIGGDGYHPPVPTSNGYLKWDANVRDYVPVMSNGAPALPVSADMGLAQGRASATALGTETGRAQGALANKAVAAPNIDFLIGQAEKVLPQSTGSGAGAMADKTAAFFGKSTPGAEAGDQLKVIAGNLTLAQPRMEGPQSDADRLLYQQMAADLGNTSLPVARRQAALKQLRTLNDKYKASGSSSTPHQITNDVEFEALPSGAEFIGPDGKHRRKP